MSSFSMRSKVFAAAAADYWDLVVHIIEDERGPGVVFFLSPPILPTASFTSRKCVERLLALSLAIDRGYVETHRARSRGRGACRATLYQFLNDAEHRRLPRSFAMSSHTHVSISILNMGFA